MTKDSSEHVVGFQVLYVLFLLVYIPFLASDYAWTLFYLACIVFCQILTAPALWSWIERKTT